MKNTAALAGLALLAVTAVSAEARDRWRYRDFTPWHDDSVIWLEDDEDEVVYYDDEDDVIIRPRERLKQRALRDAEEGEGLWWLEDGARRKLEARPQKPNVVPVKPAKKAAAKPLPASKAKQAQAKTPAKPVGKVDPVVTASIAKPVTAAKTNLKPAAKPVAAKAGDGSSIGCTAGAAVIVGYGFADVKPKACTGKAYAYTANRAGKTYEIKLTAASGEITDVRKLN